MTKKGKSYLRYNSAKEKFKKSRLSKFIKVQKKGVKVCLATVLSVVLFMSIVFPYVYTRTDGNQSSKENTKVKEQIAEYRVNAKACLNKSDREGAIDNLTKAIKLNSNNASLYEERANVYLQMKKDSKALEDYNNVIKYAPERIDIYNIVAEIYYNDKNYENACVYYSKALENSNNINILIPLANSYMQLGEYKQSIEKLNNYINLKEDSKDKKEAYYIRGINYLYLEEYKKAIEDFKESILLEYNIDKCKLYIGKCYYGMEIYNEAISYYEEYFKNCNEDYENRLDLAVCYYNNSDYENAKENFEEILNNTLEDVDKKENINIANYYMGIINLEENSYSEAIVYFDECVKANYEQDNCLYNQGVAYLNNSDKENAKLKFKEVVEKSKNKDLIEKANELITTCL